MQSEDGFSFLSAVVGAGGQTLSTQTGDQQTLLLGLMLSSVAKSLPSLEADWKSPDHIEDWLLLLSTIVGAFAAGIQTNLKFLNPNALIYALLVGLVMKTAVSIVQMRGDPKKNLWEDLLPLIIALLALAASLPWGSQYALLGVFFGYLAKTLSPQGGGTQS